jgi:putative ABC transport system ATP-binding protein
MIELNNLSMSYALEQGRLEVLTNVNFEVTDGDTVAIVGPSGSGKTTLLVLLAGLELPAEGSVRLDGRALDELDEDALADLRRDHIGIVFQSFHLVPSLTALGNAALPLEIAGAEDSRARAQAMLERVGLGGREDHYPAQLSGGEQQRVAIARALVHAPKLLLADEPTGNLDLRTGETIIDLLFELNADSGSTLILVTHDEALARRCQRVVRLHEGQLIEEDRHAFPA